MYPSTYTSTHGKKKKSLNHKQQFKNVLFEMNNVVGKQTKYSQVSEKGVDNILVSFFIV